jgi:hypothetical protein
MPPLQLTEAEFQNFSVFVRRIQEWLEGLRLSVPAQAQVFHMHDCGVPKIQLADKDDLTCPPKTVPR